MLFAERDQDQPTELAGLPELALQRLSDADARELLASSTPGRLDERVRQRIIDEARGNPLALLELPRGVSSASLAGGFAVADSLPLVSRVEGELSAPGRPATRGDATAAAPRCSRTDRRSNAPLASRCRAWSSDRSGCSCRSGRPHRGRYASYVPPPTASVGDLPRCVRRTGVETCIGRWQRPSMLSAILIAAPGIGLMRRSPQTRRLPSSSSCRLTGLKLAAGSPPRPHFCSAPLR